VAGAMKTGGAIIDFASVKRLRLAKGCIKDRNRIKQPQLYPVKMTVTPVFPLPLAQAMACRG